MDFFFVAQEILIKKKKECNVCHHLKFLLLQYLFMMALSNHEAGDAQGKQGNSGEGDSKGKGIIDLSDVSDDEIYVPSSDSDSFHSDDECKLFCYFYY